MSGGFQPSLDFSAANTAAEDGEALIVDVEGYEGPLHVLLALARTQKVDLLKLSITRLADEGAGTKVSYEIDAALTGKLGSLGQPVLRSKAKEMERIFTQRIRAAFAPAGTGAAS